ncbi:efflux RND transporter permease subunit [Paludibacter jiangxiensis]|uniref:Multidrug efflux pump subunit AcrB n=1 Tax=Paludibacter jiangxiensis TaxID=681398 RepID=A0A171AHR1_9BACT|nr:efflux RND transporter permease subunit [Paludibacter jiangxiensis]GAT63756.1 multidrug efflux pump subunit AcrB [Paludibacter jiangxiensis]
MKQKKIGFIAWAMRNHNITNLLVVMFVIFGVVALLKMPRNEFPQFTIRQGVVVGVYPGATSSEVEEQLTKQVENYLFGFKEVKKKDTYSESKDGMMYIYVELNDDVKNADEFWSKLKHGLNEFKSSLPTGVLALIANSDFGDTSALLISLSSDTKGYKEMEEQLKKLKAECRKIPAASKIKDYGIQREKIYVNVEPEKLNEYNIKSLSLLAQYQPNGLVSPAGTLKTGTNNLSVHFPPNFQSEKDLADQIVFSDPKGGVVRLKDIATIERCSDKDPDSYIKQNGKRTILLSLEMQPGNNIVSFGKDVQQALDNFKKHCPSGIEVNVISNLPEYVNESVTDFMREFVIAIIAVVLVVMLLLPRRVASIAGLTVPISVMITLGFLYFFGVELNTVSLAGLILVLGMIVDNSIVVIDNYVDKKDHKMFSWHAAIKSARELVTPIITATLAICVVYIPLGFMMPGTSGDFLKPLPLTICIALVVSVAVALFVVPFLNFYFIKKGLKADDEKKSKSFLDIMQAAFDATLEKAFRHPKRTLAIGVGSIVLAIVLFKSIDQRLFPEVERNQFAVEVYLDEGASLESTAKIMNQLSDMLEKDKRVTKVTSFIGTSSPRFHTAYAPHMPAPNYGQLMVNTIDNEATREICEEYNNKLAGAFPNAHVKWKILALQKSKYPIELRITGDSIKDIRKAEAMVDSVIKPVKGIAWVNPDWGQKSQSIRVDLDKDKANRMGYSKGVVATSVMVGLNGVPLTTVWEGDYPVGVELKQDQGEKKDVNFLGNQLVTSPMSYSAMPLRSFAKFSPEWNEGTIVHRNGTRTLTIQIDVASNYIASAITNEIRPQLDKLKFPDGVTLSYGGEIEDQEMSFIPMSIALVLSIGLIFLILLFQFKKIKMASIIMSTMLLSLPGAAIGLFLARYPFSLTAFLGITSLCGIVVRNGIILIDYLRELRVEHGMGVKEAALAAGKRRMRPIFLTSAAASVGVIPMIISRSPLWGPLGTVICFGLLISMVLTLFILPVLYTVLYKEKPNEKRKKHHMPYQKSVGSGATILLLLFSLSSISLSAQKREISLDECKKLAVQNNAKIKEANLDLQASQETRKAAFTSYFPKISASANWVKFSENLLKVNVPSVNLPVYNGDMSTLASATQFAYFPGMSVSTLDKAVVGNILIMQPVFAGGRIINGNKLAKLGEDVNASKVVLSKSEVLQKAEEQYWQIVSLREKMKTLRMLQMLLDSTYKQANDAYHAGLINRNDVMKVTLKKSDTKINELQLSNGIKLSTMVLCQYIGLPYDSAIVFGEEIPLYKMPEQVYLDSKQAVTNREEYKLLNKSVKAEELQSKLKLGEYMPEVAVGVGGVYQNVAGSHNSFGLVMASVKVPISDWWEASHTMKARKQKEQIARTQSKNNTELLALEIEKTWNELIESYKQIAIASESIGQAEENLRINRDNFNAGMINISDLLEAETMLQQAKNQLTDSQTRYKSKLAAYLQVTGRYEK